MVLPQPIHATSMTDARTTPPNPPHRAEPGQPAPEPTAAAARPSSAEAQLAELEARHAEVSDAYLRAKAEAENTRRRADEEMAKARKYAVEAFAESLLPVKDSLEAAIAHPGRDDRAGARRRARHAAPARRRRSSATRSSRSTRPPAPRFDPHQHQAISVVPAEQEANTVVAVLQKGYLIADRVLRPALVTVSAPRRLTRLKQRRARSTTPRNAFDIHDSQENNNMGKIIGIDLGTTNSCVADHGRQHHQGDREQRRRAHHAVDRRLSGRRRDRSSAPSRQAPGGAPTRRTRSTR